MITARIRVIIRVQVEVIRRLTLTFTLTPPPTLLKMHQLPGQDAP